MDMHKAVGTSLLVIALKSVAAFAGHASHVPIDLAIVATVTVAAIVGSIVGASISHRVPAQTLRKGFAWFVLVMAGFIVWREAGSHIASWTLLHPAPVLGVAISAAVGAVVWLAHARYSYYSNIH